ncbi:MAG: coproporphyrinogen III oxidase [Alphaproteobacteria bacterium]|nr:coproporphyrinogen III oxidase [Alphaproteobacteria bacterium]
MSDPGTIALYVHWPFCRARCPYCDFNVHVRRAVDHARWERALLAELDREADRTPGRRLTSVFFGGGTPSLMAPATVAAIIARAKERWPGADDVEASLEANPNDRAAFRDFARAGVTRLSLGVQSFDDAALRALGRDHSAGEANRAWDAALDAFPIASMDLIYALPGQDEAAWRAELAAALARARDQLSLYHLTIEPGTAFEAMRRRGALAPMAEDDAARLYEIAQALCAEAGLPAYEISNHARPGRECRHNLVYWRYGDYAGIGPGAHGRLTLGDDKIATQRWRAPERWMDDVAARGHGTAEEQTLDRWARRQELLIMGLRLAEGVSRAAVHRETGQAIEAVLDSDAMAALAAQGLLHVDGQGLRATAAGRQRLDAVLRRLLT